MTDALAVSLIILNYNGRAYLDRCLRSALALDYPADKLEIILCDNGSSDGSADYVRRDFPSVRVVALDANYGFAGGNNRAVEQARHAWVALVNNDMWFDASWLRDFVTVASEHPEIRCFTCRIMNWKGTAIDFIGSAINFEGHGFQLAHGWKDSPLDRQRKVIAPCGGAMLIERQLFREVGGFDPDYFSFFEDTDLGWRLNLLGHDVLYTPRATTYHLEHATARKFPAHRLRVLYERNALFTIFKNLDDANLSMALPAALLLSNERALRIADLKLDAFRIQPQSRANESSESIAAPNWQPAASPRRGRLVLKAQQAMDEAGMAGLARRTAGFLRHRAAAAIRRPLLRGGFFMPGVSMSHYIAMHEFAASLETLKEKRRWVQSRRLRSDADMMPLLAEPLRPTWDDLGYVRFHRWLTDALGLRTRFTTST